MRARNLKPSLFKNHILGSKNPLLTLLFEGLWCLCDRHGRCLGEPKRIHGEIFPYRRCNTKKLLEELASYGFITLYEANGRKVIQVNNFLEHQRPHHSEPGLNIPPPNLQKIPERSGEIALNPSSLNPSSLNPSSLNPSSLNPDNKKITVESAKDHINHAAYNPDKIPLASKIVEHYQQTVNPSHTKISGDNAVVGCLIEGASEATLCDAAEGYMRWCQHEGKDRQYRLSVRRFYGDGAWKEFVGWIKPRDKRREATDAYITEVRKRDLDQRERKRDPPSECNDVVSMSDVVAEISHNGSLRNRSDTAPKPPG